MIARALLISLTLATPTCASVPLQPPAQYDHAYPGQVFMMRLPKADIRAECGSTRKEPVRGCAQVVRGVCVIKIAMKAKISNRAMLVRHEIAHCNGWRH